MAASGAEQILDAHWPIPERDYGDDLLAPPLAGPSAHPDVVDVRVPQQGMLHLLGEDLSPRPLMVVASRPCNSISPLGSDVDAK